MSPFTLVLLGTVFLCGTHPDDTRIRVGLYADFQNETSAPVRSAIQDELAAILIPIGPTPDWRPLDGNRGNERWTSLAVVHFKGHCDLSDLSTYPPYPWIMGRTHVSDGEVIPFSEIYCNAIRAFLAPTLVSTEPNHRSFVFGRAIGRVLAHELYHILAKTKHHGSGGLGEAFYSSQELAADDFDFGDKEVQRIRLTLLPMHANVAASQGWDRCRAAGQ